jgi:glycosyltransferase involved in cell wall biosynthesis
MASIKIPYRQPLFSIITVCLNAGDRLLGTGRTVLDQDFLDFEYIVKDGGSDDGAIVRLPHDSRIRLLAKKDGGIYDAMNQALDFCTGRYVLFLHAGDGFTSSDVLSQVAGGLADSGFPEIAYIDLQNRETSFITRYQYPLTPFYLYRRFVCHQSQFIALKCFKEYGRFDPGFSVLGDVEFLSRLVLREGIRAYHIPLVGVYYAGEGYSELKGNQARLKMEIREIRRRYFPAGRRISFEIIRQLTLPALRRWFLGHFKQPWLREAYTHIARFFQ